MQQSTWTGWFHLLWGDPSRTGSPRVRYQLVTESGEAIQLLVADSLLGSHGGRSLTGKRVTVIGARVERDHGAVRVHSIRLDPAEP